MEVQPVPLRKHGPVLFFSGAQIMSDSLEHKSYRKQIEILESRGLEVSNHAFAYEVLREVGYYKFSGYLYPLRKKNPDPPIGKSHEKRVQQFEEGSNFQTVYELFSFDRELSSKVLEGIRVFEESLKSQVAHILGAKDPFAHLNERLLDPKINHRKYLLWIESYRRDLDNSAQQVFYQHYEAKYKGKLPIWVAIEVMSFGTIFSLLDNLHDSYQRQIAAEFGFASKNLFLGVVDNLRNLRNQSAHFKRIWNTSLYPHLPLQPIHLPNPKIEHLTMVQRGRIYGALALLAYGLDNSSRDSAKFKKGFLEILQTFPSTPLLSLERDMGIPKNLDSLLLWQ